MMSSGTIAWSDYLKAVAVSDGTEITTPDQTEAFLAVLRDHQRLLYQIIRTHCPDSGDWRDLEQEIVLQLWRSFPKYNPAFKLSTWVYRIAINTTISAYRKQHRRRSREVPSPHEYFFQRVPEKNGEREQRELLYNTIRQLRLADRSLLLLHLDGYDYEAIGQILGISSSNVGTRLTRIRKHLTTLLNPKNENA
ncbi:MAG: RNA polymerase sigma factor [Lewinella sp.]